MEATAPLDGTSATVTGLRAWAAQPFATTMDLQQWFLWTGLVIIMVIAWILILRDVEKYT